jgi:hypothetical protein
MINLASEITREMPAPPAFFGVLAFTVLSILLYLTLRLGK